MFAEITSVARACFRSLVSPACSGAVGRSILTAGALTLVTSCLACGGLARPPLPPAPSPRAQRPRLPLVALRPASSRSSWVSTVWHRPLPVAPFPPSFLTAVAARRSGGPLFAPSSLGAPALCALRAHGYRAAFFLSPAACALRTSFATSGRFLAPLLRRGLSCGRWRLRLRLVALSARRCSDASLWFGRLHFVQSPSRRAGLVLVCLVFGFCGGSASKPPATQASTFNLSATLPLRPPIASPAMQAPACQK